MYYQIISLNFFTVITTYYSITINMAVIKSKNAKKNSIITFILLFFTKFLIPEPKAAHGEIEIGQMIKATEAINIIEKNKFPSFGKKLDAAILDIVQAFGLTI